MYTFANNLPYFSVVTSFKITFLSNTSSCNASRDCLASFFSFSVDPLISGESIPISLTGNLYIGEFRIGNLDATVIVSPS